MTCLHDSQVRILIDKFGLATVRRAWYNSKEVAEHVIEGYTKVIMLYYSCFFSVFCQAE